MNRHASMNRIYRLIFSQVRNAWVPVAETARGRGKSGRAKSLSGRGVLAAAISMALTPLAHSGPTGGQIVAGSGSITSSGNTTDIHQSSQDLSISWQSFTIGAQQTVDFLQPSSSAIAVNRIVGTSGSEILGHLEANGQVYLINPNGIIFGKGAEVNVGGLVASTLNVNEASLAGSTRSFTGGGTGSVINDGAIEAAAGGYVALLGNHVSNQGLISAQLGTVALGAGSAVTLTFAGYNLVHLTVDQSVLKSLAENRGLIQADGGRVLMTAGSKDALLASVVNNTGVIEARTVENHEGTITLLGGMAAGTVNVGGTLDASAPGGGDGGSIATDAAQVKVANDARVTTAASLGLYGTWLIDPATDFTVAPTGGDMSGATVSKDLNSTDLSIVSSTGHSPASGGGGGNINVDDSVSWSANSRLTLTAANNVNVNENISASGATAAFDIDPNTANGAEAASGTGTLNLAAGRSITLSGAKADLSIATASYTLAAGATINLPNVSPASTAALVIDNTSYTVINSLGVAGATTGTNLQGITGHLAGNYALGSDINASATATWNAGAGFSPIGNTAALFAGTFDGLGHTIDDLVINRPATNDVALFGITSSSSVIRHVGLSGGSISGSNFVGALVGQNYGSVGDTHASGSVIGSGIINGSNVGGLIGFNAIGGTISTSYATGKVNGIGYGVGGLVGYNYGTIISSHATSSVSGNTSVSGTSSYVGGLAGLNFGTITDSYAEGSVSGTSFGVGGLVGGNGGTISHSYATSTVSSTALSVGGLAGFNAGTISTSDATGSVSGTGNDVGGLVGFNAGTISTSYAMGSVSGANDVGGLVGNGGTISDSYATGRVSGANYVGGLVGYNNATSISASYALGSVSGANDVGGLVGFNAGTISTTYSTGSVSGAKHVGGLGGINSGTISDSFWDVATSGQRASAGGKGLTTAQMQSATSFTGWSIATTGGSGDVWRIYQGHTDPLLLNFLTPLALANSTVTYNGSVQSGASTTKSGMAGAASSGINVGVYDTGLYSTQQGYDISGGALTIDRLASVAWVGGATGNWSKASNWAGGAIPDLSNVAAVTIPKGTTVTYDSGVLGTTTLSTLSDSGALVVAAGRLVTTGNLSTGGFEQSGGTLEIGGTLSIKSPTGGVTLGDIDAGALSLSSEGGAITQTASTALDVSGQSILSAYNGLSGASAHEYAITLFNAGNEFGGAVSLDGTNIQLLDSSTHGLTMGNTTATGKLVAVSRAGAITQAASTALDVSGEAELVAYNGLSGASAVKYAITAADAANEFQGVVAADGSTIALDDASALTASVDIADAASLRSAGALHVAGTIGTNLTTTTTGGTKSTTFGTTTVGDNLNVTSTGAVTTATPTTVLMVDGAGTTTANPHVTVNGVVGATIK
jgi:filamentous hemagglutinin family protein